MDHLCYLCLVFVMLSRLFIAALWSPEGKGLNSWLLFVMGPQGFWGSGENGYLFSGIWGALVIIFRDLGSKLIVFGI